MIDIGTKYQASVFGNFADIEPTPDIISKVMILFHDKSLIPGTVQETSQRDAGQPLRLRISSPNDEWNISFLTQRINIEKKSIDPKGQNLGPIKDFIKESCDFFERILSEFKKKGNRVALITGGLLREMTHDRLNHIYCRLFKPISFYDENIPFEWNSRSAAKLILNAGELAEKVNVITIINRIQGHMAQSQSLSKFDRIEVAFDINTTQENPETRFDMTFINAFFSEAYKIRVKILQKLEELFND